MAGVEIILVDRGDLPSLAALGIQPDPTRIALLHPQERGRGGPRREELARRHAEVFGAERLVFMPEAAATPELPPVPEAMRLAQQLVEAAALAQRLGATRVVDSRQVGPAADLLGEAVDHVTAVTLLAQAGPDGRPLAIDLPVLDLPDAAVVDLAEDAGVPMDLAWPCDASGPAPCAECESCLRWRAAFEEAGLTWPWALAGIA